MVTAGIEIKVTPRILFKESEKSNFYWVIFYSKKIYIFVVNKNLNQISTDVKTSARDKYIELPCLGKVASYYLYKKKKGCFFSWLLLLLVRFFQLFKSYSVSTGPEQNSLGWRVLGWVSIINSSGLPLECKQQVSNSLGSICCAECFPQKVAWDSLTLSRGLEGDFTESLSDCRRN